MDEVKPGVPRGDQVMDVVKTADRLFGDDEESGVDEPKFDISLVGHTGKKTMLLRTMACV